MMKKIAASLFLLSLTAYASAANAASGGINTAFSKGATNIGIMAGTGSSLSGNYTILGIGVGYYIMQGLEIGIDAQHWFSQDQPASPLCIDPTTGCKTLCRRILPPDID